MPFNLGGVLEGFGKVFDAQTCGANRSCLSVLTLTLTHRESSLGILRGGDWRQTRKHSFRRSLKAAS